MANPYSTRFFLGRAPQFYTVPNGKRAVIKTITALNLNATSQLGSLTVAGQYVWFNVLPGSTPAVYSGLQIVVNAGEQMYASGNQPDWFFHASGYLLDA